MEGWRRAALPILASLLCPAIPGTMPAPEAAGEPAAWALAPEDTIDLEGVTLLEGRWSPDSKTLALVGADGLYVTNDPFQTPPARILEIDSGQFPELAWSPRGDFLAIRPDGRAPDPHYGSPVADEFLAARPVPDSAERLLVYERRAGRVNPVAHRNRRGPWTGFAWISDRSLLYLDVLSGGARIPVVVDAATGGAVADPPEFPVVWLEGDGGRLGLRIGTTGGGEPLTVGGRATWWSPHLSPDGRYIAVRTISGRDAHGVILDTEGVVAHVLPPEFRFSEWTPENEWAIGTTSDVEDRDGIGRVLASDITVVRRKGWEEWTISTPGVLEENPSWLPASGRVAYAIHGSPGVVVGTLRPASGSTPRE